MSRSNLRLQAAKQHGQTLAEFAISLPLVLLLLFGILEFGRMFQSWVTLQNAARTAVRYAVTGQYNEQKYDLDYLLPCYLSDQVMDPVTYQSQRIVNGTVNNIAVNIWKAHDVSPPSASYQMMGIDKVELLKDPANNDLPRRVDQAYKKTNGTLIIDRWETLTQQAINDMKAAGVTEVRLVAINKDESLYSTWYGRDGIEDCTPNDDTLQYRKDMLRLASIYDEARRGASGLALDASLTGDGELPDFKKFLYNFWSTPSPSQQYETWFNVMICSARGRMYSTENTVIVNNPDDGNSTLPVNDTMDPATRAALIAQATYRFHTWRGPGEALNGNPGEVYVGGACILKERPTPTNTQMQSNYNVPWADAGSAGERIVIVVTYNHPLITPLGLARFVRMQASRSAVNEAFKVVNAERATGGSGSGNGDIFLTNTPLPTDTAKAPTDTPTHTLTPSLTPQNTNTPTKTPFDCSKLSAIDVEFSGQNTIYVRLENKNIDDTNYLYSKVVWPADQIKNVSTDAYPGYVSIENAVNWSGYQDKANVSPMFTNSSTYGDDFLSDDTNSATDVYSPGVYTTIPAESSSRWQLTFIGLTKPLSQLMELWQLGGTLITINNPDGGKCDIALSGPVMTPPPPTSSNYKSPTPTQPNCANVRYSVSFVEFMINGDVHLRITSSSTDPGYLRGFNIVWDQAKTIVPNLTFLKLTVRGRNADDVPSPTNPNGAGTVIWQSTTGGATTSPTTVNAGGTGWEQDLVLPAGVNASIDVYLDFTGVGASTLAERGIPASAFNGSQFRISCRPNGTGGNGSGTDPEGDISLATNVPPTPAGPPSKTPTPGPTFTYTNTPKPGPTSTNTLVPPPTKIPATTVVPPPSNTPKPPPTATHNIQECGDKC